MSEAPEKIWAFKNGFLKGWSSHGEGHLTTEYTRSDISQTRIDKANDKVRKLSQVLDNQLGTPCESIRHTQEIEELQAEVARLREALEPFADVSNFLESETEGIRHDDVFELTLESSQFIVMTYTAKQFHDARDALEYGDEQVANGDFTSGMTGWTAHGETDP